MEANVRYKSNYTRIQNNSQVEYQTGVILPYRKRVYKHKPKTKKLNPVKLFITTVIFSLLMGYIFPNFVEPVYVNRVKNSKIKFDTKSHFKPTSKYITNSNFMGENLLVGANSDSELSEIVSSGELTILKNKINNILKSYPNMQAGVYVYDYISGKTVEINSNSEFPTASIIKIPVLLALFNQSYHLENEGYSGVDLDKELEFRESDRTEGSGNLQYKSAGNSYTLDYLARIMITQSDNSATNMILEQVGGIEGINSLLRRWGLTKTYMHNRLPDLEGTNKSTPYDISRLLYNIDNQNFVTLNKSAYIKDYMSHVENRTLIKSQLPADALIIHKTGDIGKMLGDAGVIYTPSGKKFILTIMVKRPHNDYGARNLIQQVSKVVYDSLS